MKIQAVCALIATWLVFAAQRWAIDAIREREIALHKLGAMLPGLTDCWWSFSLAGGPLVVAIVGSFLIGALVVRLGERASGAIGVYNAVLAAYAAMSFAICMMPFMRLILAVR